MFKQILLAAMLAVIPTSIHAGQEAAVPQGQDPDGPQTVDAIVSRRPAIATGTAWKPTGSYAGQKGRAPKTVTVDYDRDGRMDTASLVSNGRHTAVIVASGRTGAKRFAWLIDGRVPPDALLHASNSHITVEFPESTAIDLFEQDGRPMATYQNG